jgi:hypothetical protein
MIPAKTIAEKLLLLTVEELLGTKSASSVSPAVRIRYRQLSYNFPNLTSSLVWQNDGAASRDRRSRCFDNHIHKRFVFIYLLLKRNADLHAQAAPLRLTYRFKTMPMQGGNICR